MALLSRRMRGPVAVVDLALLPGRRHDDGVCVRGPLTPQLSRRSAGHWRTARQSGCRRRGPARSPWRSDPGQGPARRIWRRPPAPTRQADGDPRLQVHTGRLAPHARRRLDAAERPAEPAQRQDLPLGVTSRAMAMTRCEGPGPRIESRVKHLEELMSPPPNGRDDHPATQPILAPPAPSFSVTLRARPDRMEIPATCHARSLLGWTTRSAGTP
jgi:hypothetical protein